MSSDSSVQHGGPIQSNWSARPSGATTPKDELSGHRFSGHSYSTDFPSHTFDPNNAKDVFDSTFTIETPKTKTPNRFSAFMNRSPKLRLAMGGALIAAGFSTGVVGSVLTAAAAAGVIVGITLLASPAIGPIGGGLIAGVAGGGIIVAGLLVTMAVASKIAAVGIGIGVRGNWDRKDWNKFEAILKDAGVPKSQIKEAKHDFHTDSRKPIEILVRHEVSSGRNLTDQQKETLNGLMNEPTTTRDKLYSQYRDFRISNDKEVRDTQNWSDLGWDQVEKLLKDSGVSKGAIKKARRDFQPGSLEPLHLIIDRQLKGKALHTFQKDQLQQKRDDPNIDPEALYQEYKNLTGPDSLGEFAAKYAIETVWKGAKRWHKPFG